MYKFPYEPPKSLNHICDLYSHLILKRIYLTCRLYIAFIQHFTNTRKCILILHQIEFILILLCLNSISMTKTTTYTFILLLNIIYSIFLYGCSLKATESRVSLSEILDYAGDNRKELEQVLLYFSHDSLKYRAAEFLLGQSALPPLCLGQSPSPRFCIRLSPQGLSH